MARYCESLAKVIAALLPTRLRAGPSTVIRDCPLREFDGDIPGADQEQESTVVKLHDGAPRSNTTGHQSIHSSVEIVDREAHVVEPQASKVRLIWILGHRRMVEPEQLDLLVGGDTDKGERHVVGFPVGNSHVRRHLLPSDDGRGRLLKSKQRKELLGLVQVGNGDRDVVKSLVSSGAHDRPA